MINILYDLNILINPKTNIDSILNIYIRRGITFIKEYLNSDKYDNAYIEANFQDAIVILVFDSYMRKGKEHIQTETQGTRSITYNNFVITDSVKQLLPPPSIRMR